MPHLDGTADRLRVLVHGAGRLWCTSCHHDDKGMLKGAKGNFKANLPCMLMAGVNSFVVSQATGALSNAIAAASRSGRSASIVIAGDVIDSAAVVAAWAVSARRSPSRRRTQFSRSPARWVRTR